MIAGLIGRRLIVLFKQSLTTQQRARMNLLELLRLIPPSETLLKNFLIHRRKSTQ
jgi:hypothetical protein